MIFVDTNVFVYAVGRAHPRQEDARRFLADTRVEGTRMFTSAEVLQEILHVYLPVGRLDDLDSAMMLLHVSGIEVLALEKEDVELARYLHERHPGLSARDLCHLASCQRRGIREIKTFDRSLQMAFYGEG